MLKNGSHFSSSIDEKNWVSETLRTQKCCVIHFMGNGACFQKFFLLPRFLQHYYNGGNHYLLTKDYSENCDILSKSQKIDLELQTIFFNIDHSRFINSMLFWEIWPCYELACEQDSLRAASKPKNVIIEETEEIIDLISLRN